MTKHMQLDLTKDEEEVEEEFADIIENKMSDDQFWGWVREWLDVEGLIEQALEWETEVKKDELEHLRAIINNTSSQTK